MLEPQPERSNPEGDSMPALAQQRLRSGPMPASQQTEPFRSAEEAWFWTMAALTARHQGARLRSSTARPRPCEPDDIVKCLDTLYRRRRIDLVHARVLRIWGDRGIAPTSSHASEGQDAQIWREALSRLEWLLRMKGIVA